MDSKIYVGKRSEIDMKSSRRLRIEDTEIALFHLSDGSVLAVENKCPHKGGLLSEGMVCAGKVHCPLHDWKIDLRSGKVYEPDDGCVTTFKTEIDELSGDIYIMM